MAPGQCWQGTWTGSQSRGGVAVGGVVRGAW